MRTNKEVATKAELAMMGFTVPVTNDTEARAILDYTFKVLLGSDNLIPQGLSADEVMEEAYQYIDHLQHPRVTHIAVSRTADFRLITLKIDTDDEQADILCEDGVFCFVVNLDEPAFSELGYSFFRKDSTGRIRRVG